MVEQSLLRSRPYESLRFRSSRLRLANRRDESEYQGFGSSLSGAVRSALSRKVEATALSSDTPA